MMEKKPVKRPTRPAHFGGGPPLTSEVFVFQTNEDGGREMGVIDLKKNPLEAIKRIPTRTGTLADTLRVSLTEKDLEDLGVALPSLYNRIRQTGSKATVARMCEVLMQLLRVAGLIPA